MKRVLATVVAVGAGVALLGGVELVQAARKTMTKEQRLQVREQRKGNQRAVKAHRGGRKTENVVGTIAYDPGAPPDTVMGGPTGNEIVGNRFNSALGLPLKGGNVTAITFFPAVANATVIASFMGPPNGTTAPVLNILYMSGVVGNTFNTVTLGTPIAVGPDFIAGLYLGAFGVADQIGLRNASVGGQGFHALQMHFAGSIVTGITALGGQNAMFRSTGNILTPVELMNFEIE